MIFRSTDVKAALRSRQRGFLLNPFRFGGGGGGGDSDPHFSSVVALLPMNGSNDSTTFTDITGRVWTPFGNAKISTTQSKFNGSSGLFDGVSDYISTAASSDFAFGTGDFTVECFVYIKSWTNTSPYLIGNYTGAASGKWGFYINASGTQLGFRHADSVVIHQNCSMSLNTWHHVAVDRISGSLKMFVDGFKLAADAAFTANLNASSVVAIGALAPSYPNNDELDGHMAEMRVTKGVGRYTDDFSSPAGAYPHS